MGHILVFIHHKQCEIMQIRSVNGNLLDLFDQSLLLDMIFLGTPQLCGGVYIVYIYILYTYNFVLRNILLNIHMYRDPEDGPSSTLKTINCIIRTFTISWKTDCPFL